ncbi:MAG: RNA pyrophosphohydrolase [Salaquimonas sp.]|jgi:putative (di)nucleoside polyphosphate hydrolase|nr:RNA pyrophosphohydrolase [Salaquimonas sp.]
MCASRAGDLPYRPCVGIMVLNRAGLVWTGRRKRKPRDELAGSNLLWQMPQGGIDKGEEAEPAARRELWEETGITSVSLIAEAPGWIRYDLPDELIGIALKGRFRGQKQKWFVYRFEGAESEIAIDPPPDGHTAEFDAWAWKPMEELPGLIVPFKRKLYEEVVDTFSHLVA